MYTKIIFSLLIAALPFSVFAGPGYVSGKVTSLLAHGQNPYIRLSGNIEPDNCEHDTYGWIGFQGTPVEQARVYATAMAMALAGKTVTVYTNSDGGPCKIANIQITEGLN